MLRDQNDWNSKFKKSKKCFKNPGKCEMYSLTILELKKCITAWKVPKHGVISGPHFPVFSPNTGKYNRPEITPYLDTFHALDEETFENISEKTDNITCIIYTQ